MLTSFGMMMGTATDEVKKLRVFHIDDHPVVTAGSRAIIEEDNPEQDMTHVGTCEDLTSKELPNLMSEKQVDVVLVDIRVGNERLAGLDTIRELRRRIGSRLGIVALTSYPQHSSAALDAGADDWCAKEQPNEYLRSIVRNCKHKDSLSCLELFSLTREIEVTVSRNSVTNDTRRLRLKPDEFALLHYLAEERNLRQQHWLAKQPNSQSVGYVFKEKDRWAEICKRYETRDPKMWNSEIPKAVTGINKTVGDAVRQKDELKLVITPGGGNNANRLSMYSLNEFVEPSCVVIH